MYHVIVTHIDVGLKGFNGTKEGVDVEKEAWDVNGL